MTLILRRLEQWSFGPDGPRWRRPHRASYSRLHSSLISRGRETMGGRGLVRDPLPEPPQMLGTATQARTPSGLVTRDDQRSYVKIEALLGRETSDIHDSLREACGEDAVQRSTVCYWASVFREGDHPSNGGSATTTHGLRM